MNTRKQVFVMTALILVAVVTLGIYGWWDPSRASTAEDEFQVATIERASRIFAQNCRLCHGDVGEGGAAGARLPAAPALNRADLQGFMDISTTLVEDAQPSDTQIRISDASKVKAGSLIIISAEKMDVVAVVPDSETPPTPTASPEPSATPEAVPIPGTVTVKRAAAHTEAAAHSTGDSVLLFDAATLKEKQTLITNTIMCGRVGTAMPAWAQTQNGPLSDEQIRQLMTLITTGRWDIVQEEVNRDDLIPAHLTAPITADDTSIQVNDVTVFSDNGVIRTGGERMRITDLPEVDAEAKDKSGTIGVERGVLQTLPLDHPQDAKLYRFPEAPEPSINMASCGQTAQPAAAAEPPGLIEPFTGQTVEVTAQNISYDTKEIDLNAGGQVRIRLTNKDDGTKHNIAFYKSATDLTPVSTGSVGTIFEGSADGVQDDTVFDVPAPGTYFFRCDVHPTIMTGTLVVK